MDTANELIQIKDKLIQLKEDGGITHFVLSVGYTTKFSDREELILYQDNADKAFKHETMDYILDSINKNSGK